MKINRDELLENLYEYSRHGHGLILGSPGAGKTYSLGKLRDSLIETGIPALLVPVDRLGGATPNDIKIHLGIETSLSEKLKSEYDDAKIPAVLIIDGFDAARNLDVQTNLLTLIKDLISTLGKSWNILISVRSFDAKKSRDLLKLFPKKSDQKSKYYSNEIDCENFFIPALTDDEVLSVKNDILGLEKLYNDASDEFKDILRNPFNLWLLNKISEKNKNLNGLDKVGSEIQLLDKFWEAYVSSTSESDKRETILSSLSKDMVKNYSLTVKKDRHYRSELDSSWKSLFSDEILIASELTGQRVAFSHNILFDYAVSLLVIDEDVNEVVKFLTEEPARALFLRPSLTYYYARLWFANRGHYWNSFSTLLRSEDQNLKIFARLVPASVAVKLFNYSTDLSGLDELSRKAPSDYTEIVTRILQAYDFIGSRNDHEWLLFLKKLSLDIRNEYLWSLAKLTGKILDQTTITEENRAICGEIGRNLLTWIWEQRNGPTKNWLDGIGSNLVISLVAEAFDTNSVESEKIIRKVLGVIKEDNFPIQYIYRLTDLMPSIWSTSPSLVGDIYRVVFSYKELSQDQTSMGTPILPLLSNRKQDFEMCHYHLVQQYPTFIEIAPMEAIQSGIDCLNAYIWQEHILRYADSENKSKEQKTLFSFRGKTSSIVRDGSYIWDAKNSYRDEQLKIANMLFSYIEKNISNEQLLENILDIFSQSAVVAFWWKRLLNLGSKNPKELASILFDLCMVEQIVDGLETEYEAVKFIIVAWPYFTDTQKNDFQTFLMSLDSTDEIKKKYLIELQEKIISKIPKDTLTNEFALKLKDHLESQGKEVANRPPYWISPVQSRTYTDEDFLKDKGTDISDPNIKMLLSARADLSLLTKDLLNGKPTQDQVVDILQKAQTLYLLLAPSPITGDKPSLNMAWTEIGNAMEIVVRSEIEFGSNQYLTIKNILLSCSKVENPYPRDNANESFTRAAYSHYAKTEAAQGLVWFARFGRDKEIMDAIIGLSEDTEPEVRYLVCREIWRIRGSYLNELWLFLDDRSKKEKNAVVLGALAYSLSNTFYKDHSRGEAILKQIYVSINQTAFNNDDIQGILDVILWLHLENKSKWASDVILEVTRKPKENLNVLNIVIGDLLGYLNSKTLKEKPNLFQEAKATILASIPFLWKDVAILYKGLSPKSDQAIIDNAKSLYQSIDNIITRIYFAADVTPHLRQKAERALSDEDRKIFYFEVKPILSLILDESKKSEFPTVFAPTAHHFMELLSGVLSFDVTGSLKMSADLVNLSESANYNLDSMAMSEVVSLTEQVLADHRSDLQNNENITNLLRLLDSFAKTGWSDALKLVWRLDEIYR